MSTITRTGVIQPIGRRLDLERANIIDEYKAIWVSLFNEELPEEIEESFVTVDIVVLIRQYEELKRQHAIDLLY